MKAWRAIGILTAMSVAARLLVVARRLGVTGSEVGKPLPGDEILPSATVQNDRAATVPAPPDRVWPWIAQLDQNKAGFYSFEALENLVGCDITNAETIRPEWQAVSAGDQFPLAPGMVLRVARVEPDTCLVVSSEGGGFPDELEGRMDFSFSWCFHLSPTSGGTRLHVRERYVAAGWTTALMLQLTSIVSAIMTWRMLRTISRLAST